MRDHFIFLPVLLQVLTTINAYVRLTLAKSAAVRAGLANESRRGLHDDAWPDNVIQINNNIRNQFELPVLFYVLVVMLWALGSAGLFVQAVAWLFALSRVVHLQIHTGSNSVPRRRRVFTFGVLMVMLLWAAALIELVKSSP
ncbi:MAG: MAPEG family protein [Gammaproteobacteria bacterium]